MDKVFECPYDLGGYFIIRGQEKVILAQEQGAKNRMICDRDRHGNMTCYATSFTIERKSRTTVAYKDDKFYLIHNSFDSDIPILVVFFAMGMCKDRTIATLICHKEFKMEKLLLKSFLEFATLGIQTKEEAVKWLESKLKGSGMLFGKKEKSE